MNTVRSLARHVVSHPAIGSLVESLARRECPSVNGIVGPVQALIAAEIASRLGRPVALVLDSEDDIDSAIRDLATLQPEIRAFGFNPAINSSRETVSGLQPDTRAVIATCREHMEAPIPRPVPKERLALHLSSQDARQLQSTIAWLDDADYERVDLVTEPGEYTTRGGIVDVFPEGEDDPVRIEFLDETVVSLRRFDPLSQRSVTKVSDARIFTRVPAEPSDRRASELLPGECVVMSETDIAGAVVHVALNREADASLELGFQRPASYLGNLELLKSELQSSTQQWFVACASEDRRNRISGVLGDVAACFVGKLSGGFANPELGITLLTERELYGTRTRPAVHHTFKGLPVDNLVSLRPGDHVVHIDYGIGVFEGTERITQGEIEKDFIVLRYASKDKVLVPVENLGLLDRYVGSKDAPVRLDRIGGRSWLLAKAKAARASAEYAQELLETQARRSVARGTAFTRDTEEHAILRESFPHEETADQISTIEAVNKDMERSQPMERLVCGDVGYGKTEVALRAAFKAAMSVKQVAMLVPTTILCYQHYATFRQRLAPFPLRIEMLSRLISPVRRREILDDVSKGLVDIVIGTHVLLGPNIRFADLGLLVVDEEQKFGVRQKERIKQLRASVDVLSLTATPVPRTLYMALAGLHDISTIHTPPPGRREVLTEVAPWNDDLIERYITRELDRGGQVFFVHNRIQTLPAVHRRLQNLLPGVDIVTGHGQMPARKLEQLYLDFAVGEHRVLLSTAIVESGLDLPNVNTIIVDRADTFGLADLHQLRGRVGRSGRQAHALFLVPRRHEITPEARKRLSALLAYSQLGAGFKLALRDLEIRGAGDLLGLRQHGQIARVGLNLYAKMLKDAAARIRGEEVHAEPELALEVDAFLPNSYVPDAFERVALYRRLLGLGDVREVREFREELLDRFGRYPPVVENLFKIARVRILSQARGLLKVELRGERSTLVGASETWTVAGGMDGLLEYLGR